MKILDKFLKLWSPPKVEIVKRGFASSRDEIPNYRVWTDGKTYTFDFTCICGLTFLIDPPGPKFHWEHNVSCCGWNTDITLEDFNKWLEGKKQ